jgi:hypothetical protein
VNGVAKLKQEIVRGICHAVNGVDRRILKRMRTTLRTDICDGFAIMDSGNPENFDSLPADQRAKILCWTSNSSDCFIDEIP